MNTACRLFEATLLLSLGLSLGSETALAQETTETPQKKTTPKAKPAAAAVETKPVLEPKAIELLKASFARLAAAHSMSFTAEVTYESPSRMGFPLAYTTKSDVVMQAANANAAAVNASYTMGEIVAAIPAGRAVPVVNGTTYYLCGNTWFTASYGANGVFYRVVPTP